MAVSQLAETADADESEWSDVEPDQSSLTNVEFELSSPARQQRSTRRAATNGFAQQQQQPVCQQRGDSEAREFELTVNELRPRNCSRRSSSRPLSTQPSLSTDVNRRHVPILFTHADGAPMNVHRRPDGLKQSTVECGLSAAERSHGRVNNGQSSPVDDQYSMRPATSTDVVHHTRPREPRRSPGRHGESPTLQPALGKYHRRPQTDFDQLHDRVRKPSVDNRRAPSRQRQYRLSTSPDARILSETA